jgi:DNA-binding transcriptional MocR family regulator
VYQRVAESIARQIGNGVLREGERLPSVRDLSRGQEVSIATAVQAYVYLEQRGYLEARPRSGFYVRLPETKLAPPHRVAPPAKPTTLNMSDVLAEAFRRASDPRRVPLGAALPGPELMPFARLNALERAILRERPRAMVELAPAEGFDSLRRLVAKQALRFGCTLSPREIQMTLGTTEALTLSIRAVTRPGDLVAVESPTYFGLLQTLEIMGLRALEIPTDPQRGLDLDYLDSAIRKHKIACLLTMSCCHNPLGFVMEEEQKQALIGLSARHSLPVIEDDVWGDLVFGTRRGKPLKAFDSEGLVLYCTSFSKTVAAGCRLGWMHAGRFAPQVAKLKLASSGPNPTLPQLVVEAFLESGGYERHIRRLRQKLEEQVERYRSAIYLSFPEGTRVSRPEGGCYLWLEVPRGCDGDDLCVRAAAANISLMPGRAFSASRGFSSFVRLSCGQPWTERIERAVEKLGKLVH